jgi:hypothetical protein
MSVLLKGYVYIILYILVTYPKPEMLNPVGCGEKLWNL